MIIQKYGGALLASPESRLQAAQSIITAFENGDRPVVVVSAIGRKPDPYSTDALLNLLEPGVLPLREKDLLMACGELISVVLMAQLLRSLDAPGIALSGWEAGILTDCHFGEARIQKVCPGKILELIKENQIPLVAGFQGINEFGEITTLGRDGSDITALALAAALEADRVEIYKDTQGVQTLDPGRYADPNLIPRLTLEEAGEMADEGAKVLHKRCITLADQFGLPILVRNFNPHSPQTLVEKAAAGELEKQKIVSAVVDIPEIVQLKITFSGDGEQKTRCFQALASEKISLDVINIVGNLLYFTIKESELAKAEAVLQKLSADYRIIPNLSKIAVIGAGMKGTPGVMAKISETLWKAGVEILHSTDSHITISCLVKRADLPKAVAALRERFEL